MKANRIKPVSKMRRYEFLRERGVMVGSIEGGDCMGPLDRDDLDNWVDEQIWREAHPGQDPNVDFGEQ